MKKLNLFFAIVASLLMASTCDDGTVVGTSTAGAGGATTTLGSVSMGFGTGAGFQAGVIGIGVASLAAGGSTSMTVNFVLTDGTLYTDPVDVTFSSPCIAAGTATVAVNPVTAANGQADGTFAASGCSGADVVTATASVSGSVLTATGTITVAAASVGSIQFISATPELIGLSGTGGLGISETSVVIFRVVDSTGGPVAGTDVDFTLSTSVGGITLTPPTATSDASGNAQTVVNSGTVATSVRVNADVVGATPAIGTQSSVLVVSTGLPDQDSFSWAVQCPNIEAWNYNGVENDITVQLADRFQNPVPDGTAVTFNAEGGSVESNCQTTTSATQSGFCTATWTSANPRPANGRVTVLATAIGEESFVDANGNGTFDGAPDTFTDLPERFRDDNESGDYDVGEFFLDFNQSGTYNNPAPPPGGTGDGLFNGLLCQPGPGSGECATSQTLGIGTGGVIIMSGSTAFIADDVGGTLAAPDTVTFTIGDLHAQPMPAGTDVKLTANNGSIVGPSSYTVGCTSFDGPLGFSFVVDADGTSDSGLGVLEVTTPGPGVGGAVGVTTVYFITIDD
jgi:hypothetical protein